jgi:hypothetical protein
MIDDKKRIIRNKFFIFNIKNNIKANKIIKADSSGPLKLSIIKGEILTNINNTIRILFRKLTFRNNRTNTQRKKVIYAIINDVDAFSKNPSVFSI